MLRPNEKRFIRIPIDWDIIQEYIIDKIEGLPSDVQIININHRPEMLNDMIGLYSKEFDVIDEGAMPPIGYIYEVEKNTKTRKLKFEYQK